MAEFPQPLFPIGTRVFTRDGRSGLVQSATFAQAVGGYRYILDGVVDIFEESELQDIPFGISERTPGGAGSITPAMFAAAIATGDVSPNIREFGLFVTAFGDSVALFFSEFPGLVGQFPVAVIPPETPVAAVVTPGAVETLALTDVVALIDALERKLRLEGRVNMDTLRNELGDLERKIAGDLATTLAEDETLRDDAQSLIVTQLSGIENSLASQGQAADQTGEGGVSGFFARVGAFVSAPFDTLFTTIAEWILGEVKDGLNRRPN